MHTGTLAVTLLAGTLALAACKRSEAPVPGSLAQPAPAATAGFAAIKAMLDG